MSKKEPKQKKVNIPSSKVSKLLSFAPYYVTNKGEVFSMLTGKYLKKAFVPTSKESQGKKDGYYQVWLRHSDGTKRWHKIHRLVAELFVVNYQPLTKRYVHHIDHNKLNNKYTNLKWVTHEENIQLALAAGKDVFGRISQPRGGMFGRKHSKKAKKAMALAKVGEKHPKFKGYYIHHGLRAASMSELADMFFVHPMTIKRLVDKGEVIFEPK